MTESDLFIPWRGKTLAPIRVELLKRRDGSTAESRTYVLELTLPTRCPHDCGTRPSWMSPGQYDPCPCVEGPEHDPRPHRCQHGVESH